MDQVREVLPLVPYVPETLKPRVEPLGACLQNRDWLLNGELYELVQRKVVAQFDRFVSLQDLFQFLKKLLRQTPFRQRAKSLDPGPSPFRRGRPPSRRIRRGCRCRPQPKAYAPSKLLKPLKG